MDPTESPTSSPDTPPSAPINPTSIASLPPFVYYIIPGVGGGLLLLIAICCMCYCLKKKKKETQGKWVNQRRNGDVTPNSHAHLNVAVGDIMSKMVSIKEEGFDDPKEALDGVDISMHPFAPYNGCLSSDSPPIRHHDVILHALSNNSQNSDEEPQTFSTNHHRAHSIQDANEFHDKNLGNGTSVVVVGGIGMEQRPSIMRNNNHTGSTVSFTCPPPNYDEIFQSSSPITTSNGYVNGCHGTRCTAWYEGSGGSDSEEEVKKR